MQHTEELWDVPAVWPEACSSHQGLGHSHPRITPSTCSAAVNHVLKLFRKTAGRFCGLSSVATRMCWGGQNTQAWTPPSLFLFLRRFYERTGRKNWAGHTVSPKRSTTQPQPSPNHQPHMNLNKRTKAVLSPSSLNSALTRELSITWKLESGKWTNSLCNNPPSVIYQRLQYGVATTQQ